MTKRELYEATRVVWKIGERRNNAQYAMAVYQGIVREVYKIESWYPSGTLDYLTRDDSTFDSLNRWEFSGEVDIKLRDRYLNRFVGMGSQNPIRYVNC